MLMLPGLRHDWAHPGPKPPHISKAEAQAWLEEFANTNSFDYDYLIEEAAQSGSYLTSRNDVNKFWYCLGVLNDTTQEHRWTCSC